MELAYYIVLFGALLVFIGLTDKGFDRYDEVKQQAEQAATITEDAQVLSQLRRQQHFWFIASHSALLVLIGLVAAALTGNSAFPWWVS